MKFPRYTEAAEEVGDQSFRYCRRLLVRNGINFRPLGKVIHSDKHVSVPLAASWEEPCYIDGYSFERSPDIILVHLATIPGPRFATGCIDVALSAMFLNIGYRLEPAEPLPNRIQGFVDTQVT
jgi:hypothetical protein